MANTNMLKAREFSKEDVPQLLELMKGLARFEGYIDDFKVTEADIIDNGLNDKPLFKAYVAHHDNSSELLGMAVTYISPWTYNMRPNLVLKELFVKNSARGTQIGQKLMRAVAKQAKSINAKEIQWFVLSSNSKAQAFYTQLGGKHDSKWQVWDMLDDSINKLLE